MKERITPLILTLNEAPNIARVLEGLAWAKRIVVVDSYSEDETEKIASGYPNVAFYQRQFDTHADQWNFGLRETGITTEWVLALDADYVLPIDFIDELKSLELPADLAGYRARFRYCVEGVPLRKTVYTPVTVLFRRTRAVFVQQGHTQRVEIAGNVAMLRCPIHHDDRKSLDRWFASQLKYMRLEAEIILGTPKNKLDGPDRIRRLIFVAPVAMFFYCLVVNLAILDGRRGLLYASQRAIAELILSIFLIERMRKR